MPRRTIVLLRHAKAEQPEQMSDSARGLTPRGHSDAAYAGRWLAEHDHWPQVVVCSPARRTRQTWQEASSAGPAPSVSYEPSLYAGSPGDLLAVVRQLDARHERLLIVGHNPTISNFSALLDPQGIDDTGLRTCGLAVHEFTGDWSQCRPETAALVTAYTARAASVG
ncbi:SixA phosphatase family protein [Solwaraspora sp. WMMA2101]|uniref:SixA phosphatase family protein n=1 Tax=Solwaraspora sp. WMMA2101 TaxID=3404124 RepID=UPI003B9576A3